MASIFALFNKQFRVLSLEMIQPQPYNDVVFLNCVALCDPLIRVLKINNMICIETTLRTLATKLSHLCKL